jgi:hypothetical protein
MFFKRARNKRTLKNLLSDPRYEFRSVNSLGKAINAGSEQYVRDLLEEIGTRTANRKNYLVGLTSRVGVTARGRRRRTPASV